MSRARAPLRAVAQAVAVRGLVPPAARPGSARDPGRSGGRRRGGGGGARTRRARHGRRRYRPVVRMTRYDGLIAELRRASQPERPAPPEFAAYLRKVRLHAYKVTNRDVEELKAAGYNEDDIFEQTVSAAVAAGLERLDAGLRAL